MSGSFKLFYIYLYIKQKGNEMTQSVAVKATSSLIIVDRTNKIFNPNEFFGSWTIWRGPKNGDGLTGKEEQDERSIALNEVDFLSAKVRFTSCLKPGETSIDGEVRLERHANSRHILLDAEFGQWLLQEERSRKLELLFKLRGISCFELPGTVLRKVSDGKRYLFGVLRIDGHWFPFYLRTDSVRNNRILSVEMLVP